MAKPLTKAELEKVLKEIKEVTKGKVPPPKSENKGIGGYGY